MQRHASYWESAIRPAAPARELPARVDVLIAGAGFMGCWLALFLQRLKPAPGVLVLERDLLGYGASTRNAGFLTAGGITEMLEDARTLGNEAVLDVYLRRRQGVDMVRRELPQLALHECGSVDFDELTDEKLAFAARVNAAAGHAVFEQADVNLGGNVRPALVSRADAGLHPGELLAMLRARLARGTLAFGVNVESLADGVARTVLGELCYGRAFVCTNAFAPALDGRSGVQPARGQIIVTSPVRTATTKILGYMNRGYDYFRFVDGRLLIGGGRDRFREAENTTELATSAPVLAYLRQAAAGVLGHADFTVDHHWAGIMGFIGGQHLGGSPRRVIDACTESVAGFGGMGVSLTPVAAHEIAEEWR